MEFTLTAAKTGTYYETPLAGGWTMRIVPEKNPWAVQVLSQRGKILATASVPCDRPYDANGAFGVLKSDILPQAVGQLNAISAAAKRYGTGLMARYGHVLDGEKGEMLEWFVINNNDTSASMNTVLPSPTEKGRYCRLQVYQSGYKTRRGQYRYDVYLDDACAAQSVHGVFSLKSGGEMPKLNIIQHGVFQSIVKKLAPLEQLSDILSKSEQKGA